MGWDPFSDVKDFFNKPKELFDDATGKTAQDAANQANQERYALALSLFDQFDPSIGKAFEHQRGAINKAQETTQAGYKKAGDLLSTMGSRGRQGAADAGKRATGTGTQGLMNAGLGTSTRAAGLARGVAADTARNVQSVNEGVAGAQAGLATQQADRLSQLQTLLGGSFVNENSALANWRKSKINTIIDRQDVAGPGWLTTAANVASPLMGLL